MYKHIFKKERQEKLLKIKQTQQNCTILHTFFLKFKLHLKFKNKKNELKIWIKRNSILMIIN